MTVIIITLISNERLSPNSISHKDNFKGNIPDTQRQEQLIQQVLGEGKGIKYTAKKMRIKYWVARRIIS